MDKTIIDKLNKTHLMNEEINTLKKDFKKLKSSLSRQKIMLNSKDGNWVEAEISSFYYNAVSKGEQVKLQVEIKDSYYNGNFNSLFSSDWWGFVTLDSVLEFNNNYIDGNKPKFLFDDIKIGNQGYYKINDVFVKIEIENILRDKNNHLIIKTSIDEKKKKLAFFKKTTKQSLEINLIDYLEAQKLHRKEYPDLYPRRGGSITIIE